MRLLLIAVGAAIGYSVLFVVTWVVGLWTSTDAACDGVCVEVFPIIAGLAIVLGVLGALAGGWLGAVVFARRRDAP